jgi:hypothetical protein
MDKMNKYETAINELVSIAYGNCRLSKNGIACEECLDINNCKFRKTINIYKDILIELIDNPPLKKEDLKDGMWIWDNKEKVYIEVGFDDDNDKWVFYFYDDPLFDVMYAYPLKLEDERYYKRGVKQ